ncbi:fused MFS/spermidine synthase [Actinotalea sp. K2]|nr:fused MFS/spermidine synthase [Actinotalea sp. K2]
MRTTTGTVELVRERGAPGSVTLMVNGVPSSHLDLEDPTRLEFEYMQQMAAVVDRLPEGPLDVVHLGAAGCAMARWVDATRPGSRQLAVDIDDRLVTLVRAWFGLPRAPRLRLRAAEAREALAGQGDASADLVIRDVFAPDTTPAHLQTVEFTADVARVLRPGGLYLANCADRPPLALARSEVATVREVFGHVALVAEPGQLRGRRYGNLVVAGTARQGLLDDAGLARALRSLPMPSRVLHGPDLTEFAGAGEVLTDGVPPPTGDLGTVLAAAPDDTRPRPPEQTRPRGSRDQSGRTFSA